MSRHRSTTAKLIFSFLALFVIYISGLFWAENQTKIFIAFTTLAWHALTNLYCAWISSCRFKNPAAKYIRIKNKYIRKIFVRPCSVGKIEFADESDDRTNIIGFVLNIINTLLLLLFEVLLFIPPIPCETYHFDFLIGTHPRNYTFLGVELHSFNEIIPAEVSRAFAVVVAIILLVFVGLFEHQLKKHRKKNDKKTIKAPRKNLFKKNGWYYPLYMTLSDIAVRKNNKKLKFWYNMEQLEQIENLVKAVSENAELKLVKTKNKIVSFTVIDTTENRAIFTGLFI